MVALTLLAGCGSARPSVHLPQSVAIPAYFDTAALWSRIGRSSPTVGLAVVNPSNGVGVDPVPGVVLNVQRARANGVQVLGYVHTSYARRPSEEVLSEIDRYSQWYGVDGIFFDEAPSSCADRSYYEVVVARARAVHANAITVLNPGTEPDECFMSVADILVTFEESYAAYVKKYHAPKWVGRYPSGRFWHLVYGVATPSQLVRAIALSKSRRAGLIYMTPETLPNPWRTLPPEPLWSEQLRAAR